MRPFLIATAEFIRNTAVGTTAVTYAPTAIAPTLAPTLAPNGTTRVYTLSALTALMHSSVNAYVAVSEKSNIFTVKMLIYSPNVQTAFFPYVKSRVRVRIFTRNFDIIR